MEEELQKLVAKIFSSQVEPDPEIGAAIAEGLAELYNHGFEEEDN